LYLEPGPFKKKKKVQIDHNKEWFSYVYSQQNEMIYEQIIFGELL